MPAWTGPMTAGAVPFRRRARMIVKNTPEKEKLTSGGLDHHGCHARSSC
jgi:hypothetical protein